MQALYGDLLPRLSIGVYMLLHPWILIGMMSALNDSYLIAPALKKSALMSVEEQKQCVFCVAVRKSTKVGPIGNVDPGNVYFSALQRQWV